MWLSRYYSPYKSHLLLAPSPNCRLVNRTKNSSLNFHITHNTSPSRQHPGCIEKSSRKQCRIAQSSVTSGIFFAPTHILILLVACSRIIPVLFFYWDPGQFAHIELCRLILLHSLDLEQVDLMSFILSASSLSSASPSHFPCKKSESQVAPLCSFRIAMREHMIMVAEGM